MKKIKTQAMRIFTFILAISISFMGCNDDDLNLPTVNAGFTFTINKDTGIVSFINTSQNARTYVWNFGDETTSTEINPTKRFANGTFTVNLTAMNPSGASNSFQGEITVLVEGGQPTDPTTPFDSGLLTNGDFEDGNTGWINNAVNVVTENGNSFNQANVMAAGNPFDVNISQVVEITQGTNYTLTFDASSDRARTILAGIGLNEQPFTNATQSVNLTTENQTFTLSFSASEFGGANSRVLFDMGAEIGVVVIDNVSLVVDENGGNETPEEGSIDPACEGGSLLQDYETADNSIFSNFGGGVGTIEDNIDTTINTSAKVGRYVKNTGEPFGGITIALDSNIAFNAGSFSIDVKSQAVRQLLFKLEGLGIEKILPTSGAGWETINYDFSDVVGNVGEVTAITLIMDNGTPGDGSADWTIEFDNTRLCSNVDSGTNGTTIIDFENNLTGVTTAEFESSGALIPNPVSGTINTSSNVYDITFTNANQWWGGLGFAFADNVLDDQATVYKVKLYSTVAPTNVLFQIEVDGTNAPVGDVQTINTANEWVEVTFNLSNVPAGSNRILIRPDVGDQTGTKPNGGTLYVDDIVCEDCTLNSGGGGSGNCPTPAAGEFIVDGDFEANEGCWELIDNGGTTTISTTIGNGGNSGQIKTFPTRNPALKQTRFGAGVIQPNTAYVVTFDIQANSGDLPADGAVFQVFAFSEPAEGSADPATQHPLVTGDATFPTSWESRSYTFTTAANVDGGVSLLLELVCGGAGTCTGTVNIDNVSVKVQ